MREKVFRYKMTFVPDRDTSRESNRDSPVLRKFFELINNNK